MERARVLSSQFPPGFRFHPTDQELINHYLMRKVTSSLPPDWTIIADIELYKHNPWDLPDKALFGRGEWFFFSPRDRKYPNGVRPNRATTAGYWKATGTDKPIMSAGSVQCIGVKKALVFYRGKPPKGIKTEWVMQEYRLLDSMNHTKTHNLPGSMRLDDWVLCRVRQKGKHETAQDTATSMCNIKPPAAREEAAVTAKERCSSGEWSEHLSYFAESIPEDGENNSGEDSSSGLMWYSSADHVGGGGGYTEVEQKQSLEEEVAPAIRTCKRKQSCGVLDELLMMQIGKKMQCGAETTAAVYDDEGVFQQYFL